MEAEKHNDLLIMDDGFQDYKIENLNILCFNSNQLIGNGFVLLLDSRESLQAVKDAQIILINAKK